MREIGWQMWAIGNEEPSQQGESSAIEHASSNLNQTSESSSAKNKNDPFFTSLKTNQGQHTSVEHASLNSSTRSPGLSFFASSSSSSSLDQSSQKENMEEGKMGIFFEVDSGVCMLPRNLSQIIKCSKVSQSFFDLLVKSLKMWKVVIIDESFATCRAEDLAGTLRWLARVSDSDIQFDCKWGCHVNEEFTSTKTSHIRTAEGWLFKPTPRHLAQCRLFKLVPCLLYSMRIADRFPLIRFRKNNEELMDWLQNAKSLELSNLIGVRLNGTNPNSVCVLQNSWHTFMQNLNPDLNKLSLGLGQDLLSCLPPNAYSTLMQSVPSHSLQHLKIRILAPENVPEKLVLPGDCPQLRSLVYIFARDHQSASSSFSFNDTSTSCSNCIFCLDDSVTSSALAHSKHVQQIKLSSVGAPDSLWALPNLVQSLEVLELESVWISAQGASSILGLSKLKKLSLAHCSMENAKLVESISLLKRLEKVHMDFLSPEPTIECQEKAIACLVDSKVLKEFSFRCKDSCRKANKIIRRWTISAIGSKACQRLSVSIRNDEIFEVYEALCRSMTLPIREAEIGEKEFVFHVSKGRDTKYDHFLQDYPDLHDSLILMAKNVGIQLNFREAEATANCA